MYALGVQTAFVYMYRQQTCFQITPSNDTPSGVTKDAGQSGVSLYPLSGQGVILKLVPIFWMVVKNCCRAQGAFEHSNIFLKIIRLNY
jgi:hypothetical protein